MIATLITTALAVLGGGGLWGLALRLLARFGFSGFVSGATSGLIGGIVLKFADGVLDIGFMILRAVLRGIGKALSHTLGNTYATLLMIALAWGCVAGRVDLIGLMRPSEPPQVAAPAHHRQRQAARRCVDPLSACFWGL